MTVCEPEPRKPAEAHHTIAVPGGRYLLPQADYVAFKETKKAWACVAFATFMEALAERFTWIDEFTAVVDAPSGADWEALVATLGKAAVAHIGDQPDFARSGAELVAAQGSGSA